jgi:CRP/FNR family cyclic AMP-dependent transcriptional regulator
MASTAVVEHEAVDEPNRVLLLEQHPDLAVHVSPEHREHARVIVTAPTLAVPAGPWVHAAVADAGQHAFGAVVLSGLMARTIDIGNHPGLELYGPGDVIGASLLQDSVLPAGDSWTATISSTLAILDDEFLHAVRRWPRLVTGLFDQMQQQRDRLALQLVIAEQPRVEDRLLALFWLLSERFGRMTSDGVVVSLNLTHETLGRLIGAQRPTVTLALKALRDRRAVARRPSGGWLLAKHPDDAVLEAVTLPAGHAPVPVEDATARVRSFRVAPPTPASEQITVQVEAVKAAARQQRVTAASQRRGAQDMRTESAALRSAAKASLRGAGKKRA